MIRFRDEKQTQISHKYHAGRSNSRTHPSTSSINQSINQSISQSINQSVNQSIDGSVSQSINQSVHHSLTFQSFHIASNSIQRFWLMAIRLITDAPVEPEIPQYPQVIFLHPLVRLPDKPDHSMLHILRPAEVIEQIPIQV